MGKININISKSATLRAIKIEKIILILAITFFTAVAVRSAWLSDDAYITFRTVDNFSNGYGLTWNTVERVQTYTHPLWMFLLSAVYAVTQEIYFSAIFLSLVVTVAAVTILSLGITNATKPALLGLLILAFSKAFVDYSTSGLENPLTHLLLATFLFVYLGHWHADSPETKTITERHLFLLSLLASLVVLNRMDALLLVLPVLLYALLQFGKPKGVFIIAAGFLPFIVWELFSLFYYGFLFPNTAYAKLNTGISRDTLTPFGFSYVLNSLNWDPVTLLVILIGVVWPFLTKQKRTMPLAIGIVLYLVYIVRIGGDFMSGRFFAAPLFMAVALLIHSEWERLQAKRIPILIMGTMLAMLIVRAPYIPLFSTADYGLNQDLYSIGVEDGRGVYYQASGLLPVLQNNYSQVPDHHWVDSGRLAQQDAPCVITKGGIGYFGFFAGPDVYVLDVLALGDPLLARLPVTAPTWTIGHFARLIPHGYLQTVDTGQNQITHKNLADYYDHLSLITRGDLFSTQRLAAIWRINSGQYDHLTAGYSPFYQVQLPHTGTLWTPTDELEQYNGIELDLGPSQHASQLEIEITESPAAYQPANSPVEQCLTDQTAVPPPAEPTYQLFYYNESGVLASQSFTLSPDGPPRQIIDVPPTAIKQGYTHIRILSAGQLFLDPALYKIQQIRLLED